MSAFELNINTKELSEPIIEEITKQIEELKSHFQPKEPDEYLTRKQVAKMLQIDLSTLYAWKQKGILKPKGIGKRVYYLRSDIINAMTEL